MRASLISVCLTGANVSDDQIPFEAAVVSQVTVHQNPRVDDLLTVFPVVLQTVAEQQVQR